MTFISARNQTRGRGGIKPGVIAWHSEEFPEIINGARQVANFFHNQPAGPNGSSAHWTFDNNHEVQCVRHANTAWGIPGFNRMTIHFELGGYAKQTRKGWTDPYSRAMLARAAKRAAKIQRAYKIPARWLTDAQIRENARAGYAVHKGHVTHRDVTRALNTYGGHTDPGPDFPRDVVMTMVKAEADALAKRPWTKSKVKKSAAALAISLAVLAGITQVGDPKPKPASVAQPTAKPSPKPAHPAPFVLHRTLRVGAKGKDVRRLEAKIRRPINGKYSKADGRRVIVIKKARHIRPYTPTVGPRVAKALGWKYRRR